MKSEAETGGLPQRAEPCDEADLIRALRQVTHRQPARAEEEAAARVLRRLAELLAAEGERPGVARLGDHDARAPE
jgi:hypothetical protein